ncbi:MAG: hypothetical protein C0501_13470 [Isosphaera sp.]|nr:hypothetical protein [Isosphaera sp.]
MDEQLVALYHRHVGRAFERQRRLVALLEKQAPGEWAYDPATATLTYSKLTLDAPILGTHAPNDTWLWAASNKHLRLTLTNRALVDAARSAAHRLGVHALGAPAFPLAPLLGPDLTPHAAHVLGTVLSGELGYDAFHTFPHEAGRELVLIRDKRLAVPAAKPLPRLAAAFPAAVVEMAVPDHKAALAAYARDIGLSPTETAGGLVLRSPDGREVTARFDARGRLTVIEGLPVVAPRLVAPVKKPPAKKPAAKKPPAKAAKPAAKAVKKAPPAKKPAPKKPAAPAKKAAGKKPAAKKR